MGFLSSQGGHTIQDEGVDLPAQVRLDFIGAGVTAADGVGKTTVTIPGGLTTEEVQDAVGAMFTDGTGIDSVYDDGAATLTVTVDL